MNMKALTTVWYAGREYSAGETISPECDLDGETLKIMGQAEYVVDEPPAPAPAPAYKLPTATSDEPE